MKNALDQLLLAYKVQPVGRGYIDCITTIDNAAGFIRGLTDLGVEVTEISWWCHCPINGSKTTGCPHGGGGPRSLYFDGWFSEMYQVPNVKFENNDEIMSFLVGTWPTIPEYLPCLVPAFWLDVPDDWRNLLESHVK